MVSEGRLFDALYLLLSHFWDALSWIAVLRLPCNEEAQANLVEVLCIEKARFPWLRSLVKPSSQLIYLLEAATSDSRWDQKENYLINPQNQKNNKLLLAGFVTKYWDVCYTIGNLNIYSSIIAHRAVLKSIYKANNFNNFVGHLV